MLRPGPWACALVLCLATCGHQAQRVRWELLVLAGDLRSALMGGSRSPHLPSSTWQVCGKCTSVLRTPGPVRACVVKDRGGHLLPTLSSDWLPWDTQDWGANLAKVRVNRKGEEGGLSLLGWGGVPGVSGR